MICFLYILSTRKWKNVTLPTASLWAACPGRAIHYRLPVAPDRLDGTDSAVSTESVFTD